MNAGMKMVKYLLFAFNFIFVIFGFVLIGIGAMVEIMFREVVKISSNAIAVAPILMIVIGVFMLLIGFYKISNFNFLIQIFLLFPAFFGACGAYKESYCMITSFAVFLTFIFILELAATLSAYILRNNVESYINDSFEGTVRDYSIGREDAFDFIQSKFKCCGANSPNDYNTSVTFSDQAKREIVDEKITNPSLVPVPDSCCVQQTTNCGLKNGTVLFQEGCVQKIEMSLAKEILVIGGVGLAVIFIQITGIAFACLLMRSIKRNYEVV